MEGTMNESSLHHPERSGKPRFWPFLWLAPLMALAAWPRRTETGVPAPAPELAPWRVAYPQVNVIDMRAFESLRGRCLEIDVTPSELPTRSSIRLALLSSDPASPIVFRGRASAPEPALHAALQARVWGFDRACVLLDR